MSWKLHHFAVATPPPLEKTKKILEILRVNYFRNVFAGRGT